MNMDKKNFRIDGCMAGAADFMDKNKSCIENCMKLGAADAINKNQLRRRAPSTTSIGSCEPMVRQSPHRALCEVLGLKLIRRSLAKSVGIHSARSSGRSATAVAETSPTRRS